MTALQAGQQLEGTVYRVVCELGAGGMGVVYEVEHVRLKKRYVAKVIHEQVRGEAGVAKRMEREAHVLAEINHPNIVQVHDVGTTPDGTSYFVMEKLEGLDLRNALKHGGLARGRAIQVTIDILGALDHVHQRGIVHRDIKPENIYLARQPNGTVTKVLDFGIAHIFDGDGHTAKDRITKTGGFVGTFSYAAPEQMQGQPAAPPNDVYACALVLFELLAGRGPFDDDPGVGLTRCFKPAPRIDALVPNIGTPLADLIAEALEQAPAKRPTASAFASRLRTILAAEPANARGAVDADVDDLLQQMALQSARGSFVPTAQPATPLMANAPHASVALGPTIASAASFATAPTAYNASTPPAHATVQSAGSFAPPQGDTTPGLYATVNPTTTSAKRRSGFQVVSAAVAVVVLVGAAAGAGALVLSRRNAGAKAPSTVVASEPPPLATAVPAPSPTPTPMLIPTATETTMPAASTPATATASATAAPAKAAPKPAAAPAAGRAKKDGYVDNL